MPESMFGRPSQHLLPYPQASAGGNSGVSDPPVQPALLPFKDFRFNSIGKQPELLSRISLSQPVDTEYHSPTPSPMSTPPPALTNDSQPKSSSRPTLFQQLAGNDFSAMGGGSRWNASTSQSNGSLASRIQMSGSPPNETANAYGTASRFPSPPLRGSTVRRATEDASLIPPVEVLSQPPDSSPPTPASWAPAPELADIHSPTSSSPLMNTTTITTSQIPTPPATSTASREPPFPSLAVVEAMVRGLQPSPSTTAAIDSFVARQERLQSISAKLANLAPPLPPSSSQSPPPGSSSVTQADADITPTQPSHSQHSSTPVILRHPYSSNHSSGPVGSINDTQMHTDDSSMAPFPSPTTLTQEYQTQGRAIVAAIQNISSVLSAAHSAHIDNGKALALQLQTFEGQRTAFEQRKRAEEAALQREFQQLREKREELNAKEAMLASLEKENKAREEARKGVLAKRQAQEEEKRVSEAKRVQDVQEQITTAMNELKEIEALKAKCQVDRLASETVLDNLPTEPQEGMNEEEKAVIKSRNDLLYTIKHLRRMHTDGVQKLEETNCTLRSLGENRKRREAEEAEEAQRRRAAEEGRLRAHAKMERARQLLDETRRQLEAEKKRQEVENDREQARLLVEQQAHAETQARGLGRTEGTNGQTSEHPSHSEVVGASQQQRIAGSTRNRTAREENSLPQETTTAMNVDEDGRTFAHQRTAPSSDIHSSPRGSQSKQMQKHKPISGGVMLAAPTPKAGVGHVPPKPLAATPPFSSSDHAAENVPNPAGASPAIPLSANNNHRPSFPAEHASGSNGAATVHIHLTPDHKLAFSRTPKSQTVLDATNGGSQELNIGPLAGVSPTQQTVNLRHLKRFRGRVEGNDGGDRSVRTVHVKSEENSHFSLKKEEHDDQSRDVVQASLSINPSVSLPIRPAIIPPPRPRMFRNRHEAPASQDLSSSYPSESNQSPLTREAEGTIAEQPREALPQDTPSPQATNAPVQPTPAETTNSLLLGPVYSELQASESRICAGERPTQDRGELHGSTTPSEPVSATLPHEMDGEDPSRSDRRFGDEHRRARNVNGSRRVSDHYSPPRTTVTSPTQPHRPVDSWRPQNPSNGSRSELIRATSPTMGRKRPSEFNDNEPGHRARRQRGDVWIAQDHDHDRVDSYRPHWDRRIDSEPDERRAPYRTPASALDRIRPYPFDVPRTTYDNRTYASEEPAAPATRWEQSYRRSENDDTYQRYQPSAPAYNAMADEHHTDDARVGQTYEPMIEERMDSQPDPSLLARMHSTQRFLPRGRGRGEPSRGRGDYPARGRGRGVPRGGTPLIERLTSVPSSLEHRLT